jgi:hypothetical protein
MGLFNYGIPCFQKQAVVKFSIEKSKLNCIIIGSNSNT